MSSPKKREKYGAEYKVAGMGFSPVGRGGSGLEGYSGGGGGCPGGGGGGAV